MAEIVNEEAASRLGAGLMFDPNDAVGQWWTTETDSDSSKDVEARMYDFLETLRFDGDDAVIVVGHSLFLQQLVAKLVPPEGAVEEQGRTTSQPIAIAPPNPFDTLTEIFSSNDPFATRAARNTTSPSCRLKRPWRRPSRRVDTRGKSSRNS